MTNNRKTFTLIELLVVIAIISILITVLVSAIHTGIDKAKKIECVNHLRQFGTASMSYSADNFGQSIISDMYGDDNGNYVSKNAGIGWKFQIASYIYPRSGIDYIGVATKYRSDEIYMCSGPKSHEDLYTDIFECPNAPDYVSTDGSVTYNDIDEWRKGGYGCNDLLNNKYTQEPLTMSQLTSPSDTITIGDSLLQDINKTWVMRLFHPSSPIMSTTSYFVHDTGINILWADSHVSWEDDLFIRNGVEGKKAIDHNKPNPKEALPIDYYFEYDK